MNRRFSRSACTALFALLCFGLIAAPAVARVQVGQTYPVRVDTAWEYPGSPDGAVRLVWQHEIVETGATYIAVHFDDFQLADGDYLQITDAEGGQTYRLSGRGKMEAGTFWARHIKGDTMRLELYASSPAGAQGFVVTEIATGDENFGSPEAICGADDKENAVCYVSSNSTEYNTSKATARLLISGAFLCTGWLASASDHLVTNEHCITSNTEALNTDYEFMAEAPTCGSTNCQLCHTGDVYSGGTLIRDNANLDYSLVQISDGNPAGLYGFMEIDDRVAIPGEQIYIPQHPAGRAKELGIESSHSSDTGGVCRVLTVGSPPCGGSGYNDVGYYCDTEGGSSGSPVLATSSNKVIALHHCANCPNRGVPIHLVWDEIGPLLGPECTVNADCDDGLFCNGTESCSGGACQAGSNPCPAGDTCDEPTDTCITPVCNANGTCEAGEDCNNCAGDCPSGGGASCGNGICEPGEDCSSCSADCRSKTGGKPSTRYCCGGDPGGGSGPNPVDCSDSRCTSSGWQCSMSAGTFCCGNGTCETGEDGGNCAVDCLVSCSTALDCNDGVSCTDDACNGGICSSTPSNANCPDDGLFCNGSEVCDAIDDCGSTGDPCASNETCNELTDSCDTISCLPRNASCSQNSQCCSASCKNNGRCR